MGTGTCCWVEAGGGVLVTLRFSVKPEPNDMGLGNLVGGAGSISQTPLHPLHPSPTLPTQCGTLGSLRTPPSHKFSPYKPGGDSGDSRTTRTFVKVDGHDAGCTGLPTVSDFPGGKMCHSHRSEQTAPNTKDQTKTKRENKTSSINCRNGALVLFVPQ